MEGLGEMGWGCVVMIKHVCRVPKGKVKVKNSRPGENERDGWCVCVGVGVDGFKNTS